MLLNMFCRRFFAAGMFLTSVCSARVSASDQTKPANDPFETVKSYIDAFNHEDIEKMAHSFAKQGFILDGMPPHVWQGPNAPRDWYRDAKVEAKHLNVTDYHIKFEAAPRHNEVHGKSGYIVLPVAFSYKVDGKPINQTGAYFTVALTQESGKWLIVSWAWTKGAILN